MSGSFIEGWAVHAERLMAEAGLGGAAVRLQQLKMQLRMTINAILDSGVHAGGMTEQAAMDLMTVRGFQEEGEAAGKWRRACLTSAQLSTYFVGYTELPICSPGSEPISQYDEVLSHGSPPPRLLSTPVGPLTPTAGYFAHSLSRRSLRRCARARSPHARCAWRTPRSCAREPNAPRTPGCGPCLSSSSDPMSARTDRACSHSSRQVAMSACGSASSTPSKSPSGSSFEL